MSVKVVINGFGRIGRYVRRAIRAAAAASRSRGAVTLAALNAPAVARQITCVATAGGTFPKWLEGKTLPGIAALQRAAQAA